MSQQSRIIDRKSPLKGAKRKGVEAAYAGRSLYSCPYKDKTTPTGGLSWSRAFINAWKAGYQSVAQGDLFSYLVEPSNKSHTQGLYRKCSTVEHQNQAETGVGNG
jgi:ribosome modulation factor